MLLLLRLLLLLLLLLFLLMLFVFLLKGIAVGIAIALPVGPVGVLCVRRTIFEGRLVGLISGIGAVSADTIFGIVASHCGPGPGSRTRLTPIRNKESFRRNIAS